VPIQSETKLAQLADYIDGKLNTVIILFRGWEIACIHTEEEINLGTKCAPPDLPNHCFYICDANGSE
jgi:hypothetical protein